MMLHRLTGLMIAGTCGAALVMGACQPAQAATFSFSDPDTASITLKMNLDFSDVAFLAGSTYTAQCILHVITGSLSDSAAGFASQVQQGQKTSCSAALVFSFDCGTLSGQEQANVTYEVIVTDQNGNMMRDRKEPIIPSSSQPWFGLPCAKSSGLAINYNVAL